MDDPQGNYLNDGQEHDELFSLLRRRAERVERSIRELRSQVSKLQTQLQAAETERSHLVALLGDRAPPSDILPDANPISDSERVVTILGQIGRPLHYRQIADEFTARGWPLPSGADPVNALLARFYDDQRLYRPARGTYALRPAGKQVSSVGTHKSNRTK